ncbi:hypothetical protein BHM03_00032952, partial [Ensete ventricosum]
SFGVRSMETVQQHSADRRSTYLAALTLEIERKLQKVRVPILGSDFRLVFLQALISPRQRPELLQQLFADVALEVEDRARGAAPFFYLKSLLKILKCCYVMDLPLFKVLPMFSGIFICSPVVRIDIQTNRKRFFPLFSVRYTAPGLFSNDLSTRTEDDDKYKAKGMLVQLHFSWRTYVGQYPRHIISLFFRLLYPWYWPSSCWNFIMTCVRTVVFYVLRIIGSSWENMRKPKDS